MLKRVRCRTEKEFVNDAGRAHYPDRRLELEPVAVLRDMGVIKNDLHRNSARINGQKIERLMITAKHALDQSLEAWWSPDLWDKSEMRTLAYLRKAAEAAEELRDTQEERSCSVWAPRTPCSCRGCSRGRTLAHGSVTLETYPRHDLDMASTSLVKYFEKGRRVTHPDMSWEPKPAFNAVPVLYAADRP